MRQRVVSLVPSLTELVWTLGRGDLLVGRTRFCVEPPEVRRRVEAVGGTKDPDVARVIALAPDLVLANREENRREDVEALRAAGLEVVVTDPTSVDGAVSMVKQLGAQLGALAAAEALAAETRAELDRGSPEPRVRVFVCVWWKPLLALGNNTYGHDLLQQAGGRNVLEDRPRYPEVSLQEVAGLHPEVILLPDEPYRFRGSQVERFARIAPVHEIDGKLLWWYGRRMPGALRTIRSLLREAGQAG